MTETTCGIYAITGPDGTVYVGSSENIPLRWRDHRNLLRSGRHHSWLLQAAWAVAGENAFVFSVIEEVASPDLLIAAEQRHIDAARAAGPVFNIAVNASQPFRGLVHSEESRRKMSVSIRASLTPEILQGRRERFQGTANPGGGKLDDATVLVICGRLVCGEHPKALAAELGVSQELIYQIRSGRNWTHLVPPETVTAMMAVRQNPWADGTRTVTDEHRKRFSEVGKARKGIAPSAERREQISRQSRGSGNPKAKVTGDQVREIRALLAGGARNKDVAGQFGLHPNTVSKIKSGEIWSHLT